MNIDEIENTLGKYNLDPNKAMTAMFELSIWNQAYLEEIVMIQHNMLDALTNGEIDFKSNFLASSESIKKRVDELRVQMVNVTL